MKSRQALREQIVALLKEENFPALVELAGREPGVATTLLQFFYDPEDLLQWRALEGLGEVVETYPAQAQKIIGRLLWLLNEDSGSFGWGAAAALGEIARRQLSLVKEIVPMFYGFLEHAFSRGSMLWGLGRMGEAHPEMLAETLPLIEAALGDPDPQVRVWAAWCLGKARVAEAAPKLRALLQDGSPAKIYHRGELRRTTVGRVIQEVLDSLKESG
jgi:hypothetical protein